MSVTMSARDASDSAGSASMQRSARVRATPIRSASARTRSSFRLDRLPDWQQQICRQVRAPRLAEITQTAWWQTWLAPHYAWGLLVSALASLATLSRETAALSAPITVAPARASADTADITPEDDDEDIALAH